MTGSSIANNDGNNKDTTVGAMVVIPNRTALFSCNRALIMLETQL